MGSDAKKAFNAVGRDELLWFDPETLTIVEDEGAALADPDRLATPPPEWLVQSVMDHGVDVPIIVRLNGKDDDGTPIVEVVNGRQRVRAVREANRRLRKNGGGDEDMIRVPGIRTRGDDVVLLGKMIRTNELVVSNTPLARARLAQRYLAKGRSVAETAAQFGVKDVTIKAWLALLDCAPKVQKAVESGELPATTAATLSKLPTAEQETTLANMRTSGALRGASGIAAAERATGKGRAARVGQESDEEAGAQLPSRVWLRRLLAELEATEGREDVANGAIAALKLVLEGKKPRGNQVAEAWRAVQKRFSRGRVSAEVES